MAEHTASNKKEFSVCLFILAAIYSCGTLLYYSQTFLLFKFYDNEIVKAMLSGWNYLAQAAGIILFVLLFKFFHGISGKRKFQVLTSLFLPLIMSVSVFTHSGAILILMMILLNLIVGVLTAFAFSLIASYIAERRIALCFAGSYSIGGIITCIVCRLNEKIMVSFYVIILSCVFVGIISALILLYKDIDLSLAVSNAESSFSGTNKFDIWVLYLIIALMAMIFALGANDPALVESGSKISLIYTRFFYAGGLMLAAVIFDKNHTIGGICALTSILYPIMIIILYKEMPIHYIPVALTDTFLGFYAVFRAGIFMSLASGKRKFYIAPLGLCISRIIEGIVSVFLVLFGTDRLVCFIIAGVLFVPLIMLFCYMLTKYTRQPETTMVVYENNTSGLEEISSLSFAEIYHLTRREEEISSFLAANKTNGEIADLLFVSESTVRFHVSNILKKTGLKNRREVGRKYNELSSNSLSHGQANHNIKRNSTSSSFPDSHSEI